MFTAIKFVAPYASTVASFVKPMLIPDQVMVELNKIIDKLFDLDKKLDKIVSEIKEEFKLSEYNAYLNKLHNIQALYTRFINMPNTVTLDALNEQGKRNEMFQYLNWLHREVTGQSLNPIIDIIKGDDDYPKFIKWTQLILSHYAQAMLLHGICVQLRPNVTKNVLDQTLTNDTGLFEKNLHKQGMATVTYDYLSGKYPFREWLVCILDPHWVHHRDAFFYANYEDDQAILLIVCDKDGKRIAMSTEKYDDIWNH
ncbi:unnamed protein product [Oppiella nova]|uniref:Uncharacterized protein n=1 Tax=Oppiella nova TaxID=334625 RepID=A0A7R9M3R1_9ACAR|nr:unnamed protein product [Oppiella nova]CAG2170176.1 unnamed protein product [Oppiella nova]